MYGKKFHEYGSYRDLFSTIDQLEAWRSILGSPTIEVGEMFLSPFRSDTRGTCYLRTYRGTIFFTDFTDPARWNKYTCVHALAHLERSTLREALNKIVQEQKYSISIHTGLQTSITGITYRSDSSVSRTIHFEPFLNIDSRKPAFTKADKLFWSNRIVNPQDLTNDNQPVFSIHHYYIDDREYYPDTYPCFGYYFPNSSHVKIYCPNNEKDNRFPASSTTSDDVWTWFGNDLYTDWCIITKSYKDGVQLYNILDRQITVYAFQNEGCIPSALDEINQLYPRKLVLFDNDMPGLLAANKLTSILHDARSIIYPHHLGKDTDDLVLAGKTDFIKPFIHKNIAA